ncbi:MAG: hypothetical protein NTU53_24260 [Planctomycetota bacterium]|nr:hypothetical protein [Planctomycetota bacterium]
MLCKKYLGQTATVAGKSAIDNISLLAGPADIAGGKKTLDADLAQLKTDGLKLQQDKRANG